MFDDPLLLARAQFGLNIAFHILFPSITIALAWFLVYLRVRAGRTQEPWALKSYALWVKIFALSFALGVVSGIVMSFQFGTNWPGFMQKAGNVAGPLLGYEVLTAFFLEATFLGVMLFGRDRVPGWLHLLSALLVAVGTTGSAFWILALNSWMQTPQGFEVIEEQLHVTDWWAVIFNPSFPYRLTHMLLASGLTASFLVAGVSAFQLLRNREHEPARRMFRLGVLVAAVLIPVQITVGDLHGLNTLEHQPAKIAAIEAIWKSGRDVPLVLIGWPNSREMRTDYAIEIPGGASLDPAPRPAGRAAGARSVRRRAPAGGAGVLRLPRDGGRGRADAAAVLAGRGLSAGQARHPALDAVRFAADDLRRLDRNARRLAGDRDRAPALHRVRCDHHRGDRFERAGEQHRRDARSAMLWCTRCCSCPTSSC